MPTEPNDIVRAAEIDKLLSRANVHRMRGDYAAAEDTYREAFAFDESRADLLELVADMLEARGQVDKAVEEYKKVLEMQPGRVSAETKYARVVLRIGEREHQKALAQELLENPNKYVPPPRHPLLAFLLSGLVPGIGQIYNGELWKGVILVASFVLSLLVLALSATETKNLLQTFGAVVNPLRAVGKPPPVGGLVLFFTGVLMLVYIYAVIDAPIAAAKHKEGVGSIS